MKATEGKETMKAQGNRQCSMAALIAVVTGLGLLFGSQASAALVVNGDAETGDLTGWSGTASPPGIPSVETFDVFAGSYSFQVKRTDPAVGAFQFMGTDGVITPIDPTQVYVLSFDYKITANSVGGLPAVWLSEYVPGEIDHEMSLSPTVGGWTPFSKTIGPSGSGSDLSWNPGATKAQILMFAVNTGQPGTGTMLFDNVSLEIIPEPSTAVAVVLGFGALLGLRARRSRV